MNASAKQGLFQAEIIADSYIRVDPRLTAEGFHRLTTIVIRFPRIVLAELNTHRLFSRNSASSRAIPVEKMLESVLENPFVPNRFPLTHKGMQADQWIEWDDPRFSEFVDQWFWARDQVVAIAMRLHRQGISKQLVNRFLEPVLMHTVIVSSTEWSNFFKLRVSDAAQNEIHIIAELMLDAMNHSKPALLQPGEWHLPFGDRFDQDRLNQAFQELHDTDLQVESIEELMRNVAVARCARVSYDDFLGKDNYVADARLYKRLHSMGHWSPFEHVARAMNKTEYSQYAQSSPDGVEFGWSANFRGFVQLRRTFERDVENLPDDRLLPVSLA